MSMTLDELRDWHARRAGWEWDEEFSWDTLGHFGCWVRGDESTTNHPFPPTLDGADASFPKGWDWWRMVPIRTGEVTRWAAMCLADPTYGALVDATDSKTRDLYELSKLAWEQEAAR